MPSGDAQGTWFPEMVARLRSNWHEGMSMPALISLRDELDEMLQGIRAGRNIRTPIITCRKCGMTGPAAPPNVSVRALISNAEPIRNCLLGIKPACWKRTGPVPARIVDSRAREKS